MADNKSIYRQILESADFYSPSVYDLLSFYQTLETTADPLDGAFVPVSSVNPGASDKTLIFAIGLIPPTANITGRLLDRSATIDRLAEPSPEGPGSEDTPDYPPPDSLVRPGSGLVEGGRVFSAFGPRQNKQESAERPHLGVDIAAPLNSEVRAAAAGVVVSVSPDGVRDSYGNTVILEHDDGRGTLYAHLNGFAPGLAKGQRVEGGQVIGYVGRTSAPKNMHDGPHLHFEVMNNIATGGAAKFDGVIANRNTPKRQVPKNWLEQQGMAFTGAKIEYTPEFTGDGATTGTWSDEGASSANKAAKTASQVSQTELLRQNLGQTLTALQRRYTQQLQAALQQMIDTPPLRLLVNPRSFRVNREKLIADGDWGRNGNIIEHWGENQDTVEASGKIAAFYSLDAHTGGGGLTRTGRQFSKSYQNLLSLWLIYKNNGGVYFPDPISDSSRTNLSVLGSVYIYYDGVLYIGSFDNMSLTEADSAPFSLEYSFSFKVRASFILDHLDDAQYTYAKPNLQQGNPNKSSVLPTSAATTTSNPTGFNPQPNPEVLLPPNFNPDPLAFDDLEDL